jgi:predicted MFS family arabinose efflux permease
MFNVVSMSNIINQLTAHFAVDYDTASKIIYYQMYAYGVSALFVVVVNKLITRYGTLLLAMSLVGGLNLLIWFSGDFDTILLLRILYGVASSMVAPTSFTLIRDLFGDNKTSKLGYLLAVNSIFGILATMLSGYLHWRTLFLFPAILSFVTLLLLLTLFPAGPAIAADRATPFSWRRKIRNYAIIFRKKEKRDVFGLIFTNSFVCAGFYAYLGFYLNTHFQLSLSTVALILVFSIIGSIGSNLLLGKLNDRWGNGALIRAGFFLLAVVFVLFAVVDLWWTAIPVIFLYGLSRALIHSNLISTFLDFPERLRNTASSLNSFIVFLGGGSGVMVLKYFFREFGYAQSLIVLALILGGGQAFLALKSRRFAI